MACWHGRRQRRQLCPLSLDRVKQGDKISHLLIYSHPSTSPDSGGVLCQMSLPSMVLQLTASRGMAVIFAACVSSKASVHAFGFRGIHRLHYRTW